MHEVINETEDETGRLIMMMKGSFFLSLSLSPFFFLNSHCQVSKKLTGKEGTVKGVLAASNDSTCLVL